LPYSHPQVQAPCHNQREHLHLFSYLHIASWIKSGSCSNHHTLFFVLLIFFPDLLDQVCTLLSSHVFSYLVQGPGVLRLVVRSRLRPGVLVERTGTGLSTSSRRFFHALPPTQLGRYCRLLVQFNLLSKGIFVTQHFGRLSFCHTLSRLVETF
jgi:hypothetical protein